jgi:hypothetical protein
MAAAATLPILATATTAICLIVAYAYAALTPRLPAPLPRRARHAPRRAHALHRGGLLRRRRRRQAQRGDERQRPPPGPVAVELQLRGVGSVVELATELEEIECMVTVSTADVDGSAD